MTRPARVVEIERLVLSGLDVSRAQADEIRVAVEQELAHQLTDEHPHEGGTGDGGRGTTPAVRIGVPLDVRTLATDVAQSVSRSIPAAGSSGRGHHG